MCVALQRVMQIVAAVLKTGETLQEGSEYSYHSLLTLLAAAAALGTCCLFMSCSV
jgi:hypothetical protein